MRPDERPPTPGHERCRCRPRRSSPAPGAAGETDHRDAERSTEPFGPRPDDGGGPGGQRSAQWREGARDGVGPGRVVRRVLGQHRVHEAAWQPEHQQAAPRPGGTRPACVLDVLQGQLVAGRCRAGLVEGGRGRGQARQGRVETPGGGLGRFPAGHGAQAGRLDAGRGRGPVGPGPAHASQDGLGGGGGGGVLLDVDPELAPQGRAQALLLVVLLCGQAREHGFEALGVGLRDRVLRDRVGRGRGLGRGARCTGAGEALLDRRRPVDAVATGDVGRAGSQLHDLLREEPPQPATEDLLRMDDPGIRPELVLDAGDGGLGGRGLDDDAVVAGDGVRR